jgi:hypothetical protein
MRPAPLRPSLAHRAWTRPAALAAAGALVAALASCGGGGSASVCVGTGCGSGGGSGGSPSPGSSGWFRFANAAAGSAPLTGSLGPAYSVASVTFPTAAAGASVVPGPYNFSIFPTGNTIAMASASANAQAGHALYGYAYWPADAYANATPTTPVSSLPLAALVLDDPVSDGFSASASSARARFVHLACAQGPLDLYLVAPGAALAQATPTFSNVLCAGSAPASGQNSTLVAPGSYEVVATDAGTKTVRFDSGSSSLALAAGQDAQLAMVSSNAPSNPNLALALFSPQGGSAPVLANTAP